MNYKTKWLIKQKYSSCPRPSVPQHSEPGSRPNPKRASAEVPCRLYEEEREAEPGIEEF